MVWLGLAVIVVAVALVTRLALSGGRGRTPRSRRGYLHSGGTDSGGSGSGGSSSYAWVDATGGGSTDCGGGSSGGGGGGGDGGGGGSC